MLLTKVDGAIMGPISKLMGFIFNALYNLFFGMGITSLAFSIIVFTVLIRLIMFPLSVKMTRSSKIQSYLQPEFQKIQKKYKGKKDQESMLAQQRETQELQKKYGIKMTSGCATSLIQFPIFIALYNVMQNIPAYVTKIHDLYEPIAKEIIGANGSYGFMSTFASDNKIQRISSTITQYATAGDATPSTSNVNAVIDVVSKCGTELINKINDGLHLNLLVDYKSNFEAINKANDFIFRINLTETPGWHISTLMLIPIASFVFQLLAMLVQPKNSTGDVTQDAQMKSMRTMMFIMPLFSFWLTVNVPAGLGLYWATSALISFLITFFTNIYYNHVDMEKIVEKARLKAEIANAKRSASGKVSLTERLTAAATGESAKEESVKKQQNLKSYSNVNLKNYKSDSSYDPSVIDEDVDGRGDNFMNNNNVKKGSLTDRANAVWHYNHKGE